MALSLVPSACVTREGPKSHNAVLALAAMLLAGRSLENIFPRAGCQKPRIYAKRTQ
jgi:hypothetical protein